MDGAAAKEAVESRFTLPSGFEVADAEGTRANALEENDSDRELNKSISTILAPAGAAKKKHKDIMSIKPNKCYLQRKCH